MTRLIVPIMMVLAGLLPAQTPVRVLIITGLHPYEEDAFTEMFRSMKSISFTHAQLGGEAETQLKPENAKNYDALVFYDMYQKCEPYIADLLSLLGQGKGTVFLHHALGSCAGNDQYGYMVGGRARFGKPPGSTLNTSGFRANTSYRAHIEDKNIPITAGMDDFDVTDEVYSSYFVNTDSHVFLTTDNPLSGRQLAWTYQFKKSPVVYIQLGHDHVTYENPNYRKLVERSILWVSGRLKSPATTASGSGEKLYSTLGCLACHGVDAKGARGPSLKSPELWSRSDARQHAFDVIKNGVKGSEMPAYARMASDPEIRDLVNFLSSSAPSSAASIVGDAEQGLKTYRSQCEHCHGPGGRGGLLGPELKSIVQSRGLDYLIHAIRQPAVNVPFDYGAISVTTKDGRRLSGVRRNEDSFSLQMVDQSGRLHMFQKDELRDIDHDKKPVMPAYDESRLPQSALLDTLAYLKGSSD